MQKLNPMAPHRISFQQFQFFGRRIIIEEYYIQMGLGVFLVMVISLLFPFPFAYTTTYTIQEAT